MGWTSGDVSVHTTMKRFGKPLFRLKAKWIAHFECVSEAVGIQHSMRKNNYLNL
jgi:hypothetical protein